MRLPAQGSPGRSVALGPGPVPECQASALAGTLDPAGGAPQLL